METATQTILNIKNDDDLKKFSNQSNHGWLIDYLKSGKYNATYKKNLFFTHPSEDILLILKNNCLYDLNQIASCTKDDTDLLNHFDRFFKTLQTQAIRAIVINCKKRKANQKLNNLLLVCGDNDRNDLVFDSSLFEFPVVSFSCMARFFKNENEFKTRVANGKLKIVDYTPDASIELTKAELETIKSKNYNGLVPPEPGYSLIDGTYEVKKWHRSGSVLFYDEEKDMCILTGQDEGTYFGVELPKKCNTIKQAFECLIPKEVKGKKYLRQGEWFIFHVFLHSTHTTDKTFTTLQTFKSLKSLNRRKFTLNKIALLIHRHLK